MSLRALRWALSFVPLMGCADAPAATEPRAVSTDRSVAAEPVRSIPPVVVSNSGTAVSSAAPVAPTAGDCNGHRQRLHGTSCCESRGSHEDRFPGQVFLECRGPNVGKSCTKKGDCDVACTCPGGDDPRGRSDDPRAPKDGMVGLTGTCAGQLRVGVWMCQIDEDGKVTHMIVD